MKQEFKFNLGEEVEDVITGFSGMIMSRIQYLTRCNQYGITQRKLTNDGKRPEWEYIDENRLKIVGTDSVNVLESLIQKPATADRQIPGADGPPPIEKRN